SFGRPGDPAGATFVYLAYAIGALLLAWRASDERAGRAGWALLLLAALQLCITRTSLPEPWVVALLGYATIALGVRLSLRTRHQFAALVEPANWAGIMAPAAAVVLALSTLSFATAAIVGWMLLWASAIFVTDALLENSS